MTRSGIYVLKGHIQTERQKIFFKNWETFCETHACLGLRGFQGWRNFPLAKLSPAKLSPGEIPPPPVSLVYCFGPLWFLRMGSGETWVGKWL